MSSDSDATRWDVLNLLKETSSEKTLALVILNRPLEPLKQGVDILWNKALLKAAADGGACRLEALGSAYIPDIITGDFDSCPRQTLQRFKDKGVEVAVTEDQDNTDFTKCLAFIADKVNNTKEIDVVVCLDAFGGRLDHTIANINTLFTARKLLAKPVILISDTSVAFLLHPGRHEIIVSSGLEADWCGLIPIGCPCSDVTTTGLKWNLTGDTLQFGELISTSNTYDSSGIVTVNTSHPLLWTMGYRLPYANDT